jgi:hypothetical protein
LRCRCKNHASAEATETTLGAVTREDLVEFHRARYGPARTVVSMIGAIDRAQAQAIAEQLTRGLPAGDAAVSMPAVPRAQQGTERRIAHPASQSHILIGLPGITRGDPDFFALTVGNYVLGGGGFVSRLYDEVRDKRRSGLQRVLVFLAAVAARTLHGGTADPPGADRSGPGRRARDVASVPRGGADRG